MTKKVLPARRLVYKKNKRRTVSIRLMEKSDREKGFRTGKIMLLCELLACMNSTFVLEDIFKKTWFNLMDEHS